MALIDEIHAFETKLKELADLAGARDFSRTSPLSVPVVEEVGRLLAEASGKISEATDLARGGTKYRKSTDEDEVHQAQTEYLRAKAARADELGKGGMIKAGEHPLSHFSEAMGVTEWTQVYRNADAEQRREMRAANRRMIAGAK